MSRTSPTPFALRYSTFVVLWAVAVANAQSGGGYLIKKSTIDSGGYTYHTGGGYKLGGTVGQHDAGPLSGGGYKLTGGFWSPASGSTGASLPIADPTGITKPRFISFSVPAAATAAAGDTALRVKLTTVHNVVPPYTAGASIPFTLFEGQSQYVGPPVQYVESVSSGTPFMASKLQCAPYYQDWTTISLLHVTGEAIVPSSSYGVEHLAASCLGQEATAPCLSGGTNVSAALPIVTGRWGDAVATFQLPTPPVTQPDFNDIGALVNKFKSAVGAPIKARAMLAGEGARGLINITPDLGFGHISACVDGFKGLAYPYKVGKCTNAQTTACTTNTDCGANGPCILCP